MGKIIETIQNRFDGGMTDDKHSKSSNKFSISKHFDIFSFPHKLMPNYRTVSAQGTYDTASFKAFKIIKFVYAKRTSNTYMLFGFGVVNGTDKPKVFMWDIDGGNLTVQTPSNAESARDSRNEEVFFYYKGYIYMWTLLRYLVRFDTSSANPFDDNFYDSGGYSSVAAPVHHPNDDIAYFFHDNYVSKLDNITWSPKVLTLPDNFKITAACAYGNYLAIACVDKGSSDVKSIVYLWDRDSSLATLTDRIDFGKGAIVHLATLDNKLTAVVDLYLQAGSSYSLQRGKILIKQANGNFSTTLNEIVSDESVQPTVSKIPPIRYITDNKLYFATSAKLNGDHRGGIWVVDSLGRCTIELIEPQSIKLLGQVNEYAQFKGIYKTANMWWIGCSDDGTVMRSDYQNGSWSDEPVLETLIIDEGDPDLLKKAVGVAVSFEPLIDNCNVRVFYRKDADFRETIPVWTEIYDFTTSDDLSHGAINIEATGDQLPDFNQLQYRVEAYGAAITGIKWKNEILEKQLF